ncbi:11558_t:CDS:2 [Ambispora gerdemannii]|uniref:11558_t:CDS:1 n=1 Tax=Ambispora gerdemannii TaxID=144530 RepID=A0A9N8YQS5_9GLOM|nr:11558_t:CDS:2 [Ambispora gerdemannii]
MLRTQEVRQRTDENQTSNTDKKENEESSSDNIDKEDVDNCESEEVIRDDEVKAMKKIFGLYGTTS